MSDNWLVLVLRVLDLDRALSFYRDMLRFRPVSYNPEQRTARLLTPEGGTLLLIADPDLDVTDLLTPEEAEPGEERVDPAGTEESGEASPLPEIREVAKGETLHFPGEDLLVTQERLAAFGIPDLLLEETPGVEQVLKMRDPEGYGVSLHESLRIVDAEVIDLYRKGPDLLEGALLGLEDGDLDLETTEGEPLRQLVLQMIDFDLEMMQRMKWAMAESGRSYTIPLYDSDEWAEKLQYATRSVHVEVSLLRLLREHTLNQVEAIPEAMDCHLVSEQGTVEVRTMMQVVGETFREQIQTILDTRRLHER